MTISDIFNSAINKDAVGLKAAIDDIMLSKVADAVDAKFPDVAASIFGSTTGQEEEFDSEEQELENQEEPDDDL
jgi:hypothetical protein